MSGILLNSAEFFKTKGFMKIKPGLFDDCPCGSGRIYKKCCMVKDSGIDGYSPIMTNDDDILKYTVFAEKWDRSDGPVPSFREYMGIDDPKDDKRKFYNVKVFSGIRDFLKKMFR